jgi:ethanolamine utilization protein EutN
MNIALIIGTARATTRHRSMAGVKLLVAQQLTADGVGRDGEPILVADALGAGLGDRVLVTSDSAYLQELLHDECTPIRWSVMGLCDA